MVVTKYFVILHSQPRSCWFSLCLAVFNWMTWIQVKLSTNCCPDEVALKGHWSWTYSPQAALAVVRAPRGQCQETKSYLLHYHFYNNDSAPSPVKSNGRVCVNTSQYKSQQPLLVQSLEELATLSINKTLGISGRFAVFYWQIFKADRNAITGKPSLLKLMSHFYSSLSFTLSDFSFMSHFFQAARCTSIQSMYSLTWNSFPSALCQKSNSSVTLLRWQVSVQFSQCVEHTQLPVDSHGAGNEWWVGGGLLPFSGFDMNVPRESTECIGWAFFLSTSFPGRGSSNTSGLFLPSLSDMPRLPLPPRPIR